MNPSVCIIVPCMGRTFHLRETLPKMLAQDYDNYSVCIVNWSSPDDLAEYLSSLKVSPYKLFCVERQNAKYFSLSGSRNLGADYAARTWRPEFLAFIDADVLLPSDFIKRNLEGKKPEKVYYQRNKTYDGDLGMWGSCIVSLEGWEKFKYNEEIDNYGEEDNEFYACLESDGYVKQSLDVTGVKIIQHSDDLRMQYYKGTAVDIPELKRANKKKFRVVND